MSYRSISVPTKEWISPEGFRRLRLPDFQTTGT